LVSPSFSGPVDSFLGLRFGLSFQLSEPAGADHSLPVSHKLLVGLSRQSWSVFRIEASQIDGTVRVADFNF
jgi:hypothetical protein